MTNNPEKEIILEVPTSKQLEIKEQSKQVDEWIKKINTLEEENKTLQTILNKLQEEKRINMGLVQNEDIKEKVYEKKPYIKKDKVNWSERFKTITKYIAKLVERGLELTDISCRVLGSILDKESGYKEKHHILESLKEFEKEKFEIVEDKKQKRLDKFITPKKDFKKAYSEPVIKRKRGLADYHQNTYNKPSYKRFNNKSMYPNTKDESETDEN